MSATRKVYRKPRHNRYTRPTASAVLVAIGGFSRPIDQRELDFTAVISASTTHAPSRQSQAARTPFWADIPAFTAFAHDVEDALEAGELRYSRRLDLLKRADHFGIRRFDANLIIAMVQNRSGDLSFDDEGLDTPPRRFAPATLLTILITQALIVAGAWWVLAH